MKIYKVNRNIISKEGITEEKGVVSELKNGQTLKFAEVYIT